MQIIPATSEHLSNLAELTLCLWPNAESQERRNELTVQLTNPHIVFFLVYEGELAVAFAQCALRHDYVEGCQSSPVGYLEGIFVREEYRKKGLARLLLQQCINWSRQRGCTEFASDCELNNTQSLQFHLQVGFAEVGRNISFLIKL